MPSRPSPSLTQWHSLFALVSPVLFNLFRLLLIELRQAGVGRPGIGTLKVDGKAVDTKTMPKTLPMILQWDESFDIGSDTLTGVNDADYKPPFRLTAKLNKLTIKVDRPQLSPEDIKKLQAARGKKHRVSDRTSTVALTPTSYDFGETAGEAVLDLASSSLASQRSRWSVESGTRPVGHCPMMPRIGVSLYAFDLIELNGDDPAPRSA